MATHTTTILIDAAPSVVWQILSDLESWPDWTPTMLKVERLDSGPVGVGARARLLQPKLQPAVWEVIAWQPGENFTWVSTTVGSRVTAEHILEPVENRCRLTLKLRFQGIVGSVVGVLTAGLTNEYLGLEAHGLKTKAEASPTA